MGVGRTSLSLAPLALVARGVAFFIPAVIARWFGVTATTDAFYYALGTANFLLVVGAVAVGTVLVPALATLRVTAPHREGAFLGAAGIGATLAALVVGSVFAAVVPALLPRITSFDTVTQQETATFAWQLLPFIAALAWNAVIRAAVEVHGRYRLSALSPVARTIALLGVAGALSERGPACLPIAMAAGGAVEAAWLLGALAHAGVRPTLPRSIPPELVATASAVLPVLGGESMVALNVWVDRFFAGALAPGSVSLLEYADRARIIPQTLLEGSLLVVAFNAWARARAEGQGSERFAAVSRSLWWVALLAAPVIGGMVVGREALVRLLFEGGAFAAEHTVPTADTLGAFLPGVYFSLLGALAVKAHIVEGRYRLVLGLGALSFAINVTLNLLLYRPLGLVGLAVATSTTSAVCALAALAAHRQDLAGTLPRRALLDIVGAVVLATLLALPSIVAPPASVGSPVLWLWAVPFLLLLAAAALKLRRDP